MCNLCGHELEESANFCGNCGVDLEEARTDIAKVKRSTRTKSLKKAIPPIKTDNQSDDSLRMIKWCWIKTLNDPLCVLVLMAKLAKGESEFGFCDCPICNQGYREILVALKKIKESKNLTANSPEIVREAQNIDITKIRFNLSEIIAKSSEKSQQIDYNKSLGINTDLHEKVLIEIDKSVLEKAIVNVLESERGKKIISNAVKPKKRKARKEVNK